MKTVNGQPIPGMITGDRGTIYIVANIDQSASGRLAEIIKAAGCSHAGLAHRVNVLGRARGININYDKTAVSHWLGGTQPRANVRYFIADALAEKLGRPVTLAELGFVEPETPAVVSRALVFCDLTQPVTELIRELGIMDLDRRSLMKAVPFIGAALLAPQRDWLLRLLAEGGAQQSLTGDPQSAASVRTMIGLFDEMDNKYGGGHARSAALHYLTEQLLPMLAEARSDTEQRELFIVAAKLSAMIGWMTYDQAGGFGLAQRYMIQALRLCDEGGDKVLAGQVFAGLSHLATTAGSPAEGLNLARVGLATAAKSGSPLGLMRMHAMKARAHAALGEPKAVAGALRQAEQAIEASHGPDSESEWVRYLDSAYLAAEAAICFRDLGDHANAERFANEATAGTQTYGRRHTLSLTALASAQLNRRGGDVAEAVGTARIALGQLDQVRSERGAIALRDFQSRLAPYRREPVVRAFEADARVRLAA